MNPADVSDILPTPQQAHTRYFDPPRSKSTLEKVQSSLFPRVFFMRKSMKDLLEERSHLCAYLGLSSSKKQGGIPPNRSELSKEFSQLFIDCPQPLVEFNWAIIQDRGTIFGFISSEEKYVPLCKSCGTTVYVSLRFSKGRVCCGNPKCKMKLLGEFQLGSKLSKNNSLLNQKQPVSNINEEVYQEKQGIYEFQKQMIRKAAKKAHQ